MQYGGVYLSLYLIYISVYICSTHFFFEDSNCIYVEFPYHFYLLFSLQCFWNIHYFLLFHLYFFRNFFRSLRNLSVFFAVLILLSGSVDFLFIFVRVCFSSISLLSSAHWFFFFLSFALDFNLSVTVPCGLRNLSSLTRYQTHTISSESRES